MLFAFGLGTTEVIVILVVALLIFGPTKLPQLGSSVGKMLRGFKDEIKEMDEEAAEQATADGAEREIDVTPVDAGADKKA